MIQEWYGDDEHMIPAASEKQTTLNLTNISLGDVAKALTIIREHVVTFLDTPRTLGTAFS